MKTIKIFVASSEELKPEREMLASLANTLNTALEPRGLHVIVVEWENLDASMGVLHKQEEYNAKLRDCEMCLVLYWSKFGMYTKSELDTAYEELKSGNNPKKLYVYFKNGGKEPADELKEFRDSFPTRYGHFSNQFENVDTLKAHFLTQFIEYQNHLLEGSNIIEVKDGKVVVGGKEYVELANVPFVGNNDEYNDLKEEIAELEEDIQDMDPNSPRYQKKLDKLASKKEELKSCENNLWDTALTITRLSTLKSSDRLQRAIERFNQGDSKGATAILDEEEIYSDAQRNIDLVKLGREGLLVNIDELLLKIKLLHPSSFDSKEIDSKYDQITNILTKVIEYSSTIYGENSKEVLGHCKRARNLFENQPKRRLSFLEKAMEIAKRIYLNTEVDEIISIFRDIAWACEENDCTDFDVRIQCKANIVELTKMKYGEQSEKYIIAVEYYSEVLYWRDADSSKLWFEKALSICRDMNYADKEKEMLARRIFELSVINRDWEWLASLMPRYKELSTKEEILYACIRIARDTINNDQAIKYYEEAIQLATDLNDINAKEQIFGGLSRIYNDLNDIDKQIEYLKKCLEINNSSLYTYDSIAGAYLCKGAYQEALDCANRCLELSLNVKNSIGVVRSCNKLNQAYTALKDLSAAEDALKRAISYDSRNIVCYTNLASFYTDTSQIEKALDTYLFLVENDALINRDREKGDILGKMGWIYYLMEDLINAERCYKDSIELHLSDQPNEMYATPLDIRRSKSAIAGAYEALAKFYAINRKYKEAQEALDKSYAFCRDSQQMKFTGRSFWQGVIYRGMGEYQKAIDIFQQKNRARGKENLEIEKAFTFLEWGKFAEALDIARTVVEEHPDYAYAREVLGRIYKALNEKEKAREEFEACLALMREEHSPNIAIKEIKGLLDTL